MRNSKRNLKKRNKKIKIKEIEEMIEKVNLQIKQYGK